jgi:hypothetical protein
VSKQNKANRNNYSQAGRLTPDEMARERQKQMNRNSGSPRERVVNRAEEERAGRPGPVASRRRSAPAK